MILIATFSTLILLYILVLFKFRIALRKEGRQLSNQKLPPVSLVIAVRNERENLPNLLHDLGKLSYDAPWEVVMVDDHSTDGSLEYLNQHGDDKLVVLTNGKGEEGKKEAVANAVTASKHEFILQTDADCRLPEHWLKEMAQQLLSCDLVIGQVRMKPQQAFWSRFAALEFMSLQASGIALAKLGQPIMGNAANLGYRKDVWRKFQSEGAKLSSGDDVFLIQALQKSGGKISAHASSSATVETSAPGNLRDFIRQRIRWGGKTTAYPSILAQLLALLITLVNFALVAGLLVLPWEPVLWPLIGGAWLAKILVDYAVLKPFAQKTAQEYLLKIYPTAALLYPFYICSTVLLMLFTPTSWKGRSLKRERGQGA